MSKYESIEALARAVHELEKAAGSAAGGFREGLAAKCEEVALALLGSIEDLIEGVDSPTVVTEAQIEELTRRLHPPNEGDDAEGTG